MREMSSDSDPSSIFSGGKALRCFLLAALALGAVSLPPRVWAASAGSVWNVSRCSNTVPIEIIAPGYGTEIIHSPAEISDSLPHFSAFVTVVTEHVAARQARDKLCISDTEGMKGLERLDSMGRAAFEKRSLLQFVHWHFAMGHGFYVPVLPSMGGVHIDCRLFSPWIDLVVIRKPIPQIRGVVRWNERQLLADQAVLAGAKNVPLDRAMPLVGAGFLGEYMDTEVHPKRRTAAKPIEERVPPDLLWLYRRSAGGELFGSSVEWAMREARKKGAEGYTHLVLALIDRCFAADEAKGAVLRYNSILDVADPALLEQYRIDMPVDQFQ